MAVCCSVLQRVVVCCSVLQCVAVCCSMLQCVAVCCSVLQCLAVCCSVLQCVAVCCSVLQRVAVFLLGSQQIVDNPYSVIREFKIQLFNHFLKNEIIFLKMRVKKSTLLLKWTTIAVCFSVLQCIVVSL